MAGCRGSFLLPYAREHAPDRTVSGADLCWPTCYEEILSRFDPRFEIDGESIGFDVTRLDIEPFDLRKPCPYDVVLDRVTHWYHTSREWIKKSILMDELYVLNNPWSIQSMEKQTTYCAMMHLGLPVPETWMLPPKEYEPTPISRRRSNATRSYSISVKSGTKSATRTS